MKEKVKNSEVQKQKFIEKSINRHGEKFNYSKVVYINSITKVEVECKIHGTFFVRPDAHVRKVGCPKCNGGIKDSLEDFLYKAKNQHGDLYNYSKVIYINSNDKIEIICKKHGSFYQKPPCHIQGQGCSKCSGTCKKTTLEFIKEANLIHRKLYNYNLVNYKNNRTKVKIKCPKHGIFLQIPKDHLNGHGCPSCCKSLGELFLSRIFDDNKIKYQIEYKFENCRGIGNKKLPFDFYLYDYGILVEFDGRHHFEAVEAFGGEKALKKQKITDEIKNNFCRDNNLELIRIKYSSKEKDSQELLFRLNNIKLIKND